MKLRTKLIVAFALLAAFALAMAGMYLAGSRAGQRSREEEPPPRIVITSDLVEEKLQTVQKLSSVEYFYTNVASFEDQMDFYGWKVPFTTKNFIVSYNGIIRAGVDLAGVRVKVTDAEIAVTLPRSAIISHEIPEESIEVFDESRNIFNPIKIEDYTGFTREQKALVEDRAVLNGLLDTADEKARTAMEALLGSMPGSENYRLTVTTGEG